MASEQIGTGIPDGSTLGVSGGKVSFYGVTPIAQRSGSTQATLTLTTVSTSDTGFGLRTSDGVNALVNQVKEIRDTLVALGLWAGA